MSVYRIADIAKGNAPLNSEVTVRGWVRTRRDSKAGLSFIHVLDGSTLAPLQLVANSDIDGYEDTVKHITSGCSVEATGTLVESQGKGQAFEIQASKIDVVGWVDDPETYPMQPKRHSMEYLRSVAHLRPRTNIIGAVTRVRHTLAQAMHRFFDREGFYWIHTPIITASDCEGAGEMFRVSTLDMVNPPRDDKGGIDFSQDFFGREAHLTVSGQLNVESYCLAMSRVYTFGPTFRAENSNTRRHLAEFWMVEPELAFADLNDDVDLAEKFLKAIYADVLEERAEDMEFFDKWVDKGCIERVRKMIDSKFERMDYTEAVERLQKANKKWEFAPQWGADLQSEHERYLTEEVVGRPMAVVNYPKDIKAFYMRVNDDGKTVAAMDVLAPGIGEIIGGSQREERLDVLDARLDEMELPKDDYWWYRDLRKYGTVPHCGFGLGFERAIQYCTGIDNIRDVIPFPRAPKQADF
ncbi:MAG: asparagine--tRNA ligase [Deltaproteobacteria bacterium]|nr:asparagine--tRNA ligase [Deltaproteobacteria bacterium]